VTNQAEIRELFLYARDGETVSGEELARRRDAMLEHNPARANEYRTASRSTNRWRRELRTASRTAPMTVAELEDRLDTLEQTLGSAGPLKARVRVCPPPA
jgi:hypothetical protein